MQEQVNDDINLEEVIVLNDEDLKNVEEYCSFFNINPVPEELKTALDLFKSESSIHNQNMVKLALCNLLTKTGHESFNDPIWEVPKKNAVVMAQKLEFDRELHKVLTEDDKPE
jgi:hypothetical protein